MMRGLIHHSRRRQDDLIILSRMLLLCCVQLRIKFLHHLAALQPRMNLAYGHEYEVVLTQGIKDSTPNPSQNGEFLSLDQEYRYRFTTKVPNVYDLAADSFGLTPGGRGGSDIALYTDRESGRAYSYVAADIAGWRAVDVTDPTRPVVTYKINYSYPPDTATPHTSWRFRGAAVDQETGILALTEWIYWNCADCGNFGYVSFYDLKSDPAAPALIGRERLAENFSGVPFQVAIVGNYAYVATIGVGIQVVDIERSKQAHQPGEAIAGYYDTVGAGYGSPYDIAILKGNLYVPASSGHFLVLSASNPALPDLIGKIEQSAAFRAHRVSVMGDYTFADAAGTPQTMDIAVVSNGAGYVYIVNVTDPRNPVVIAAISGVNASDVSINRKGMIYVADGTTVDVIDIRDPYHPKRLNDIGNETYADKTELSLGFSSALAEKDGWVYLANQQYGMRVLDLDPFQVKIVDVKGVNISEVKYANDEKAGSSDDKERNDRKAFYVKVTTDNADIACPQMRGTISVRSGFGTDEKIIEAPADIDDYQAKYDLTFTKESGTVCAATAGGKSRFLLSNRNKGSLGNIADTTFIYGGIKPGRIVVEVEQSGAGSSLSATGNQKQKAYAQKQQTQVIVLGRRTKAGCAVSTCTG